jgi:threonine aldolase
MINLISDTVTKPTPAMLATMMQAEVGDDVFGEDPSVLALEHYAAQIFGMEAALFCPSGTMTNQIAIKAHTEPLDEVVCDELSHIFKSEVGGYAFHSGVAVQTLKGENGVLTAAQIQAAIKPSFDWLPRTRLVVLENSVNHAGGSFYNLEQVKPITALCQQQGLILHLDGARLFNVLVETGEKTQDWGAQFHSISICLSKGLGAPVGSLLIGNQVFIKKSRRIRKAFGGGMRQAGYLAAAGLYALQNNVERLAVDNRNARRIGQILAARSFVENLRPVRTNIVIFDVVPPYTAESFLEKLKQNDVLAAAFGPQTIRFVTHLHISENMIDDLQALLESF